jgi:Zn-dependent peptidase ImmA (M78 family)
VTSTAAHVTPRVLRWARESIGFSVEDAALRIRIAPDKLERAEAGDDLLTLRQAERAADVYDRPLAALFLPEPPFEEPQEAQFRRLPGAPEPPWPPAMQSLARRVRDKQEAAAEVYDLLEEEPPWPETVAELRVETQGSPDAGWASVELLRLPEVARAVLGITFEDQAGWRDSIGYTPLRRWIDAVESLGVLVMQDGTLDLELMRGFASTHPIVPAIVVNTKDDARARAFTVVHEFGHLCLLANDIPVGPETEAWCDNFAGEVLMPPDRAERVFARLPATDPLVKVDELALTFGVTPLAAAVRAARTGLLPQNVADEVIARIRDRPPRGQGSGGNYYRTQIARLGPAFIRLVLTALDSQTVTYPAASRLLETKANNLGTLRDYLEQRPGAA